MSKQIHIAVAVIQEGGKIFAAQRRYGRFKGGWEFPGGKIEAGETPEDALRREIREELAVEIEIAAFIETVSYAYADFHLTMECFFCRIASGTPVLKEHTAARWLAKSELTSVRWLPANAAFIQNLSKLL